MDLSFRSFSGVICLSALFQVLFLSACFALR